jgi:hypothetical protein
MMLVSHQTRRKAYINAYVRRWVLHEA